MKRLQKNTTRLIRVMSTCENKRPSIENTIRGKVKKIEDCNRTGIVTLRFTLSFSNITKTYFQNRPVYLSALFAINNIQPQVAARYFVPEGLEDNMLYGFVLETKLDTRNLTLPDYSNMPYPRSFCGYIAQADDNDNTGYIKNFGAWFNMPDRNDILANKPCCYEKYEETKVPRLAKH